MILHDRLVAYIKNKIKELDKELKGGLKDDTSLINSGLLDSLILLDLAIWVEEELNYEVDVTKIDLRKEWDTVYDILNFIEKHKVSNLANSETVPV